MSRANEFAHPFCHEVQGTAGSEQRFASGGLTIREHFAGLAMASLANQFAQGGEFFELHVAEGAVKLADALIAELAKPVQP